MKALVKTAPGNDQMVLKDIPEPQVTGDLVKIKVAYSGICGTDLHAFKGTYASTKTPVVLGHEFSGIVTEIGPDVKKVKIGDRVTSETTFSTCGTCVSCQSKDYNLCSNRQGLGTQINGSMAQYLVSREESVHILPDNVSMLSASLTEPLACGVHAAIETADVQPGEIVCVFGVGAIGQMVAQVCKAKGATVIVAGLDSDKERLTLAKQNGADRSINQNQESIDEIIAELTDRNGVDIAFECSGAVPAVNKALQIVRRKGQVIQMGVFPKEKEQIFTDLILHREIKYMGSRSQKPSSWRTSIELLAKGTVIPDKIVSDIVSLDDWRAGFESMMRGDGVKSVICCNEGIE